MVHSKDSVKNNNSDAEILDAIRGKVEDIVYPEYVSDDDGIPYCKMQTDYSKILNLKLKERFPNEFEKMLTCFRCEHYTKNDCYFCKNDIDLIEKDRQDLNIRCVFCGAKIHRLFSVLMSLYYKDKYHVNIPIICCTCYAALGDNSFIKNTQSRMILFAISLATSIYFLFSYFLTIFIFSTFGILLFILPFIFWGYISLRDVKNIYYLYRGRKYYKEIIGQALETPEKKQEKDDTQPEEEETHPPPGAYDSPGYDY
jgi:transcription elongation factor Elf1